MNPMARLLTLLLVLTFAAGSTTLTAETLDTALTPDVPTLTLTSPAGQSIALYKTSEGWQPVSSDRLAEVAAELDAAPDVVLDQLNAAATLYGAADDVKGWGCEIQRHPEGVWTWTCWRDS
jgi:hypothetical protein